MKAHSTGADEGRLITDQSTETQVLDVLMKMTAESLEASSLDEQTVMLVRLAALVAVDAPPVSYVLNVDDAGKVGFDEEQIAGVLTAIAPLVGTARVVSAVSKMRTLGLAIEVGEFEAEREPAEG